jgi:hypothetical protein
MTRLLTIALTACLAVPAAVADDAKPTAEAKPMGKPAGELLAAAMLQAKADGKAVFLAFGSPGCVWCKYLDKYHARPAVETVLGRHLVFVKVDVVDNPGGQDLYKKYTPGEGGVPVWAVLSADGTVLADSFAEGKDGKKSENVGFPYEPAEVAHYEKAIRAALPKLTSDEVATLMAELKAAGPVKKKD